MKWLGQVRKAADFTFVLFLVVAASGCPKATVPNVVGLMEAEAALRLGQADLALGQRGEAFNDQLAAGRVINQHPGAGAKVSLGSGVDITVSLGPDDGLPPDPGDPGRQTLEGIDSDGDGTRDDLQIVIHARYPDDPGARDALRESGNAVQEALLAGADGDPQAIEHAVDAVTESLYRLQDSVEDLTAEVSFLEAATVNTEARSDAYIEFNDALNGQFFGTEFVKEAGSGVKAVYRKETECAAGDTTDIYFVNGVWNSFTQAESGRIVVESRYQSAFEGRYPDQVFNFELAYNYHAGLVRDIIEVIGQKINEINDPEVERLTAAQYFQLYMTALEFDEVVPPQARVLTTTIEEYLAARFLDASTAEGHIQRYRANLLEGERVVLIAHSQGNLFANQAIAALMGEYGSNIGMVGVASPAAVTYNGSPYFTAHDDRVIDALRIIHDVLPSNIENDPGIFNDPRDFSNHQFAPSYMLTGLPSQPMIDANVNNYVDTLDFPTPELEGGAIVVTLEWGAQPDVDLHVFEPNGTHVYYRQLHGLSGYLDRDDVSSYGPEHYYAACDTLEMGTYRVGVNYFYGSGAETARVQVATADGRTRSYSQPLSTAVGSSGNSSPVMIAEINVSQNSEGEYNFEVR